MDESVEKVISINMGGELELGERVMEVVSDWLNETVADPESDEANVQMMVASITLANATAQLARMSCDGIDHGEYKDVTMAIRTFLHSVSGAKAFDPKQN